MTDTKRPATNKSIKASQRFSPEERSAMKERARELKTATDAAADVAEVLVKIAEMPASDRVMAERLHSLITASAPDLAPKTWYGMPAYTREGKIVCFFKAADKFKSRYATFGFEENAHIDDGTMWPTSWALTRLTATDEARIVALVKKA